MECGEEIAANMSSRLWSNETEEMSIMKEEILFCEHFFSYIFQLTKITDTDMKKSQTCYIISIIIIIAIAITAKHRTLTLRTLRFESLETFNEPGNKSFNVLQLVRLKRLSECETRRLLAVNCESECTNMARNCSSTQSTAFNDCCMHAMAQQVSNVLV